PDQYGTLSLHDALPIFYSPVAGATGGVWRGRMADGALVLKVLRPGDDGSPRWRASSDEANGYYWRREARALAQGPLTEAFAGTPDRKSTRLNSSHVKIS